MRVLFTGADGYVGAVLGARLLERGYEAVGLDTGFYRRGWLFEDRRPRPQVVTKDVREVTLADLSDFDVLVHLGELSNDPLGENDPQLTMAVNHRGSVSLAGLSRKAGVSRFIYASSCSIYGVAGDDMRVETSPIDPQTAYARCKALVERDVMGMTDDRFSPVFLRFATAFGASPRQRFDLVLNNLAGWAWTTGELRMTSDGSPWRPIIHVEDMCEAILCAIEAPRDLVGGEAFNVGDPAQNYRIREIAEIVATAFPSCRLQIGQSTSDTRSYRVSFDKIQNRMPEFRCQWDAARGARQLRDMFHRIGLSREQFEASPFTRLAELKYLRQTEQIDRDLFWTASGPDFARVVYPGAERVGAQDASIGIKA